MENSKLFNLKMLNSSAKAGVFGGIILSLVSLTTYIFKFNVYNPIYGLISFAITFGVVIVFMYKGAVAYRNQLEENEMNYLTALAVLFLTALPIYYISALFYFILNTVVDPNYHIILYEQFEEFVNNPNIPEFFAGNVEELKKATKQNLNPYYQFKSTLITSPLIALLLSLVMAFFVKKPKQQINQQ